MTYEECVGTVSFLFPTHLARFALGPHFSHNPTPLCLTVQGLQACLGASARETGRARSMTQFIRSGSSYARVEVTLWNTGADAYRPEL